MQGTIKADKQKGKVNFVELRSFWHIFRSFDRMWSFFILALQVFTSTLMVTICPHRFHIRHFVHTFAESNALSWEVLYMQGT